MMEFCTFFVVPFDENTPSGGDEEVLEHIRPIKEALEEECLDAYHELIPVEKRQSHKVWAQSRIKLDTRVIGVSLRLPIEDGADHKVVPSIENEGFLYWDFTELNGAMTAMHEAARKVAERHGSTVHVAFQDVRYRY